MSEETMSTALPEKIVKKELEEIRKRRKSVQGDTQDTQDTQDISDDLCGLSISGGGIRSSTFSIGVIQSLAKEKLFKKFDYISTVSGGGYTGSLLSTMLNSKEEEPKASPPTMPVGEAESKILQHLRNGSNYLTPGGFMGAVRLPALIVRGLVINLVLLLPFIMSLVIITEFLHEKLPVFTISQYISNSDYAHYFLWIPVGLFSYLTLSGWPAIHQAKWSRRNKYEFLIAWFLLLLIAVAIIGPVSHLVNMAIQAPWHTVEDAISKGFRNWAWIVFANLVFVAILVTKASEHVKKMSGKLVLFAVGVVGPLLLFSLYSLLVVAQVDSPFIKFETPLTDIDNPPALTQLTLSELDIESFYKKDVIVDSKDGKKSATVNAIFCPGDTWMLSNPPTDQKELEEEYCEITTEDLKDKKYLQLRPPWEWPDSSGTIDKNLKYELFGAKLHLGGEGGPQALMGDWDFFLLTIALFLLNYFFVNVNQCSLHGFYRDRLSKLYLIRSGINDHDDVIHEDRIKLSELNSEGTTAPYHIINTTLNLQGNTQESQRGRGSDFFFFSKLYCGGTHTGYCDTKKMEEKDSHINLGTAMAISAAAAAPNMGSTTIKPLIFIMTLLNLRLGYWVPNPEFVEKDVRIGKPWFWYLWKEAMGNLTAKTKRVNVSDGGHLENMAIYEMLRRKCSTIVCIDGEADEGHTFKGLITLIRIARIDLGIEIKINLEKLMLEDGRCKEHFVTGEIIYGDNRKVGKLIYVKASYTSKSDQNPFLQKYKAEKTKFPHESTADQFFGERQFEAYRALGESIGRELAAEIKQKGWEWPENTENRS
jgi:hypothetical protein